MLSTTNNNTKKRRISDFNQFFMFEFDRDVTNAVIDLDGAPVDTTYSEFEDCIEDLKIEDTCQAKPPFEPEIGSIQQPSSPSKANESHHLYCLIEREFINSGENVYKVGKSLHLTQRMSAYPKGSSVISVFKVNNCHTLEKVLLKQLDACKGLTNARDVGREYYRGDLKDVMKIFVDVCMTDLWVGVEVNAPLATVAVSNSTKASPSSSTITPCYREKGSSKILCRRCGTEWSTFCCPWKELLKGENNIFSKT